MFLWESLLESGCEGDFGRGKLFFEIFLVREGVFICIGSDGVFFVDFFLLFFFFGILLSLWEFFFCLICFVFWICKI